MGCAGFFAEQHALISYNIVPGEGPGTAVHTACVLIIAWQLHMGVAEPSRGALPTRFAYCA